MNEVKIPEELFFEILSKKLGFLFGKTVEALETEELKKITPVAQWDPALCSDEEQEQARAIVQRKIRETNNQVLYGCSPLLQKTEQTVLRNHRAMVREVSERISAHCEEIGSVLLNGQAFSEVTDVSGDGGDVHNHGRLTLTVTTPAGKFLYKPHSCKTDVVFSQLIGKHFSDIMRVPNALDYGDYGFCEYIVNRPAEGEEEAAAYYRNLGGVSALIHALGGTDFHCENILAEGLFPVPVDLETIITPTVKYFYDQGELPGFLSDYNYSLVQSGILPVGGSEQQLSPLLSITSGNAGAPVVNGKIRTVLGYEEEYLAGFDRIYDRCIERKEQLADAVIRLKTSPIRRLIRNTDSYAKVLLSLSRPAFARNEEARQKFFASSRSKIEKIGLKNLMGIPEAEQKSLSEWDIPYFYTAGGSTDLLSDGKTAAENYFSLSAVDHALLRLSRLSPEEKSFEKTLIRRSLETALIDRQPSAEKTDLSGASPITREEAVETAGELLKQIFESSVLSPSGKRGFVGHFGSRENFSAMQLPFANGLGGIFTFACAAASLDSRWRGIAEEMAEMVQEQLEYSVRFFSGSAVIPPDLCDPGLASGFAGVLNTLSGVRQLMPELYLPHTVESIFNLLDVFPIEQCTASDVYLGLAGLILSLSRIQETADVKKQVARAADRLLELKTLECGERTLWRTLPNIPRVLSGFGHGCAGIGLALLRAFEITGEEKYRAAAEDAFAFEHSIYSERIQTWPDLRSSPVPDQAMYGICSGAPGIALCLTEAKKAGMPFAEADMERAVAALNRQPFLPRDTLCCGNCSAAEAFLTLGMRDEAAALLGKIRKMAQLSGDYSYMPPAVEPFFVPTLFYGAAGLGYTLLRFAEPDRIPSVFI